MLKNLSLQILFFFLVFQLFSWFKASDMLTTDSQITHTSLKTTMNNEVSLSASNKKLVLYFFAPWCNVCHASIDNLQRLYENNANIDVIAVALDYTEEEAVVNFIAQHQLTFPVAYGNEQIKQQFKIYAYPSYYVINEENLITSKSIGYTTELGLYLRSL